MRRSTRSAVWVLALAGAAVACEEAIGPDGQNPDAPATDGATRLSLHLTDAPGAVKAVWVDIQEVYFQGGPGGRLTLLTERTGLIELTSLVDVTQQLVADLSVEPGSYRQLRLVLAGAVLQTEADEVHVFGDAAHPDGLPTTGELLCPSCSRTGLKVKLGGGSFEVQEGANALVLDYDVSQSFARQLGHSRRWMMSPVIHGTRSDDDPEDGEGEEEGEEPEEGGEIEGTLTLATDEAGNPVVTIPACPEGTARSLEDFVPIATATTLVDEDGAPIVRTGEVDEDGTFEIDYLDPDVYTLGFLSEVPLEGYSLVFEATVEPTQVTLTADEDATGVVYTITSATCEPAPTP